MLFSTTFSGNVAMGDAPETVAGVKSLGVLHAPGYPSYVVFAHAFAKVVPIGDWSFRVNLFSLVCATLTIVAVFLLARSFGASPLGASVGALALASAASFWFNAGFAKHYAFSALLVTVAALAGSYWHRRARARWLLVAGTALGLGIGASWELAVVMACGLVVSIWFGTRRPSWAEAAAGLIAMFAFAVGSLAFMVLRARSHPAVSWGEVTSTHRIVTQITQQDFRSSSPQSQGTTAIATMPSRAANYVGIIVRDLGLGACLLAVVGIVAAWRASRAQKLFLAVVGVLNVLAVAYGTGVDHVRGFFTGLFAGGFLIDVLVVVALLVALGTTFAVDAATDAIARGITPSRHRSQLPATVTRVRPYVAVGIVALVLLPSIVVHYRYADHRMPPLAERYGQRVLGELPRRSVLFVGGYEFAEPMRYRQIVAGDRPDVTIVSADLLGLEWYREQLSRALGRPLPRLRPTNGEDAFALIKELRPTRPVFLDTIAMYIVGSGIGYRAQGFVGEVVDGVGPHAALAQGPTADDLDRADRADGLGTTAYLRFPNQFVYYFHQRAHIELAKQLLMRGETAGVERQLVRAVALVPTDGPARIALDHLRGHDPKAGDLVRGL